MCFHQTRCDKIVYLYFGKLDNYIYLTQFCILISQLQGERRDGLRRARTCWRATMRIVLAEVNAIER